MTTSPAKHSLFAAALLIAVLATGCGQSGEAQTPSSTATPTHTRAPIPTSYVTTVKPAATGPWTHLPLSSLSEQGASYSTGFFGCCLGIAVAIPSQNVVYEMNGTEAFEMASVGKVPLMLTMIDAAIAQGRDLTTEERALIEAMITQSDNDAADTAWNLVGGARAVAAFLASAGISSPNGGIEDWGASRLSASGAAILLAAVVDGRVLDERGRDIALEVMTRVAPWQAWSVNIGVPKGAQAGLKNGWFPEPEGWLVNSLAYVIPADGSPSYTIAIFSLGMQNYYLAIAEVENIVRRIHADIQLAAEAR